MLDKNLFVKDYDATVAKVKRKTGNNQEILVYLYEIGDLVRSRKEVQSLLDKFRSEMNIRSKEFGQKAKSLSPEDRKSEQESLASLKYKIQNLEASLIPIQEKEEELLLHIPNIPSDSTPDGDGDSDNPVIRSWGDHLAVKKPLSHDQIGEKTGTLSGEDGAKLSGSRFMVMKGDAAKLDRRLTNFFLDWHTSRGYTEVSVPYIVTRTTMTGTGQLPKFEEDLFKLTTKMAGEDAFLIPTAEVPVTNLYRDVILAEDSLPIRHAAFTPCFRAEAGSAGRDVKGLIRLHQFHKVELVSFCKPEDSLAELEKITADAESVLQALGLPYRVIQRCTADLGFGGYKGYDIEVWMAGQGAYREISSATLFWDFQARRANLKYKTASGKNELLHTLNASGLAVGRCLAAIMELYQTEAGGFNIPDILRDSW
jgi:seryl-tRNA synthetase